jgi:ATP-dependent protease ClpP protease subunit
MTALDVYQVPQRPEALQQRGLGGLAYWGDRKPPKAFAQVFNAAKSEKSTGEGSSATTRTTATLRLYGPIYDGWFGISARKVSEALDQLGDVDAIVIRVNSPGGDPWEGMAILNMLRAHAAEVTAVVDGVAASAASYLVAGCDKTVMSPGTQMMIHDASAIAYGPAETMAKAQTFLNSVSDSIAAIYADVAGGTDESWRALMKETTWYTAKEAVAAGLADSVGVVKDAGETETAEEQDLAELDSEVEDMAQWAASVFNTAGPPAPKPPTASADGNTHTEGGSAVALSDEQITMRQKLGIAEDADEATTLAALEEALEERAEPPAASTTPEIPEGHVVIPAAKLADLEAGAQLATTTAKALADQERDAFLNGPEARGKYLPSNRDAWAKEYDRDPQATREHFKTAPVLVPTNEIGHDNPVDEAQSEDDAVYAALFGDEKAS